MNKFLQYALFSKAGLCVNETRVSMIFLLLTSLYAFPLQAEETLKNVNVSIMLERATVRQALNGLEKQSEYKFFYSSDQVNTKRRVTLNFHGTMDEALHLILGKEISYAISGKHIILRKKLLLTSQLIQGSEDEENS